MSERRKTIVYAVQVTRHRTETRHVVETATVTIEAKTAAEAALGVKEAHEEGILDLVAEWEEVSADDEGDEDEPTIDEPNVIGPIKTTAPPDIFLNKEEALDGK